MDYLPLIGRKEPLFIKDVSQNNIILKKFLSNSRVLVIGGAGSIGQAVSKEIFKRNPKVLHVVDINENNLVELVRDIRSSMGYIVGDFQTYAIDCGSYEFELLLKNNKSYDYIFNLSALKHVRSEKDQYTLMRMINVNIINTLKTIDLAKKNGTQKYFCVSTDKATNPVNMMGASKFIMELFLMKESSSIAISTARFANVAFSDGSLLHGFNQRIAKKQPISAPNDIKRYFLTPQESGELCLMSCLLGENRDIFFPKLDDNTDLITFSDIARKYLNHLGFEPFECQSEDEARKRANELILEKKWPCFFSKSDTTGEKDFEEFYTQKDVIDLKRYTSIGVIKNKGIYDNDKLISFLDGLKNVSKKEDWTREDLTNLFYEILPDFNHLETGKYLDGKM